MDVSELAPNFDVVAVVFGQAFVPDEPERLGVLRSNLLGMIAQSRRSWALIHAETDNLSNSPVAGFPEWVPGPHRNALPGLPEVNELVRDAWLELLSVFEGVLEGRLLLPHWRFDQGVNLRKMLEDPLPWSPVLIVQGKDVLPYLEKGEIALRKGAGKLLFLMGIEEVEFDIGVTGFDLGEIDTLIL